MNPTIVFATAEGRHSVRRGEPVRIGLPFPRSWCPDAQSVTLGSLDGRPVPIQIRTLDAWSDGSVRWALVDVQADAPGGEKAPFVLTRAEGTDPRRVPATRVRVESTDDRTTVETGAGRFVIGADGELVCHAGEGPSAVSATCRLGVTDAGGVAPAVASARIAVEESGPLRAVVLAQTTMRTGSGRPLAVFFRYHFHAGSGAVRTQITVRNVARAAHPGGFWDLGDRGSVCLKEVTFIVALPRGSRPWNAFGSLERGQALRRVELPCELYQDSSGGENWQSSNHVDRDGEVSTTFRGYRFRAAGVEERGLRATPILTLVDGPRRVTVAHRQFWERFPKAIEVSDAGVTIGLLPRQLRGLHEIQGGEQVTEEFVVCFGEDPVSDTPLEWVRDPLYGCADPEWYCAAEAMPHLTLADPVAERDYLALIEAAVEGPNAFRLKREWIDEYGWRNFGDLYADHEAVRDQGVRPLVSHYNNQYDAIAGFARQFFRTGDLRWFALLEDLAGHVIDTDVYRTDKDKSAYNRGLFWHTSHYTDAARATHRTYSRASSNASGGPSAEHNYSTGLMLYYFATGDARARDTVLDLARWVIDMDDGGQTVFRWLSRGHTGLASMTGSLSYHGPGRAPGNSITTLLNAFQITSDLEYLEKAEELIGRCAHPADDISRLNLLDVERCWSYTVFLQAVGRYLDVKLERGAVDRMYAYGQAVLLHFARWMVRHEYPYLDKPEILEFPTETWAAQDMRKSDVLLVAAKHAIGVEREQFIERGEFFFRYSVTKLSEMQTRTLTRPVVLMLTNGYMYRFMRTRDVEVPSPGTLDFGLPSRFVPQRVIALQRLVRIALIGGVVVGAVFALIGYGRQLSVTTPWF
jgi:hypothetical protein